MSKDETASPTPRIRIDVDRSPAPAWTGKKFTCGTCKAELQLEAADECKKVPLTDRVVETPPCPTCGETSLVEIAAEPKQ